MAKSQNSNSSKNSQKGTPKSTPVNPNERVISNSRPNGIPKGYKPTESTHQTTPPKDAGSGLKGD